ncbi:MAG: hypothetical protein ACYC6Y_20905 [Thermoguttaceae bacterium]
MKSCWILLLCLSCLPAGGCCGLRQQQAAALERENSQLNGKLWEMQFQLESLADENAVLKSRLESPEEPEASPPRRSNSPPPARNPEPESNAPSFDPGEFRPPVIEFPTEPAPEGTIPPSLLPDPAVEPQVPAPGQTGPPRTTPIEPTSHQEPALLQPQVEPVPAGEVSLDSSPIQRVALGPLVGTLQLDGKPGDDGLVIVVEPWDGSGRMLSTAADVSVVLIDPAEPAQTARYAQWNFSAQQVAELFRDGDVPGLHLELPWPGDPPRHGRMHLFVRYATSDGRNLEADSLVDLQLSGRGRWVASSTPRIPSSEQPIVQPGLAQRRAAAVQLAAIDSESRSRSAESATAQDFARSISVPRQGEASAAVAEAPAAEAPSEVAVEIDEAAARPMPRPAAAAGPGPNTSGRQRPVWAPDRPW